MGIVKEVFNPIPNPNPEPTQFMEECFHVGLSRDFLSADGRLTYQDIGLDLLDRDPAIERHFFDHHIPVVQPDQIRDCDALIALTPQCTAETFAGADRLLVLERFGVGYDMVDVPACTAAGVALCITVGAVNHSVAEGIITWMLALSHRMITKDRLLREGRWAERGGYMGSELRERTLGVIGIGGIGGTLIGMLRGFGMNQPLAYDPFVPREQAAALGVRLVSLDEMMSQADFVSVNCPLNDQTRNLIGARELSLMKPGAYLINTARGGIVNEADLVEVLREEKIAGAGVDVFEDEPVAAGHPLAELDNVILAPHSIAWTNELFRDIGRRACQTVLDFAHGKIPEGMVVNREVLDQPNFRAKLEKLQERSQP